MKRSLSLFALIALTASVLAYAYFNYYKPEVSGENHGQLIFGIDRERVHRIELLLGGDLIAIERGESSPWVLVSPHGAPGDEEKINEVLSKLLSARGQKLDILNEVDLKKYSLEKPMGSISLIDINQSKVEVFVGWQNSIGGTSYLKYANSSEVYLADQSWEPLLTRGLLDLRDQRLFPFSVDKINQVLWKNTKGESLEIRREGGNWEYEEFEIDDEAVEKYLQVLEQLRIKTFLDQEGVGDEYLSSVGLGQPQQVVTFRTDSGKSVSVYIGKTEKGKTYGMSQHQPSLFLLEELTTQRLSMSASRLRDKQKAFFFHRDEVKYIRVHTSDGEAKVELRNGGWVSSLDDETRVVNQEAVEEFLNRIEFLRVEKFLGKKFSFRKDSEVVLRDTRSDILLAIHWENPKVESMNTVKLNSSLEDETILVPTARVMLLNPNNLFNMKEVKK